VSIEPIGFATIVLGILGLTSSSGKVAAYLVLLSLFGAAAAVFIGSNNIQPAHLFLAFAAAATLRHRREAGAAIRALAPPQPGFWLACMVVYGVMSAFLAPRLMAGGIEIIPLGTSEYATTGSTVPLGPVSSNMTQSIYLTADMICFVFVVAIASTEEGFRAVVGGLIAYVVANIFFAMLDLATYATGTQDLLAFMRNARYTLHIEEEVSGLKRIVGSFTEASAFARTTLGCLAFTGTLWLCGWRPALTGALAATSLVLVVVSTSSAGLAGLPVVLVLLYVAALRLNARRASFGGAAFILLAPLLAGIGIVAVLLNGDASAAIGDYIDTVVLNKFNTDSGIQRSSWNTIAFQNFVDSWGLGVGLGTVRTSSLLVALLSNLGVLGVAFYGLFAYSAFLRPHGGTPAGSRTFAGDVRLAASNACFGLIVADLLVCPVVEQGLFFYILAAIASARPMPQAAGVPRPASFVGRLGAQYAHAR